MVKISLIAVCFSIALASTAEAQSVCTPGVASDKLICLIPQVYGVNGLIIPGGNAAFQDRFTPTSLKPLNSALAGQATLLPLASPSSGITFTWDSEAKVFSPTEEDFGPIVSERAGTIGKNKVFVGFDYQYFKYSSFDGIGLGGLPDALAQPDNSNNPTGGTCSTSPDGNNTGGCAFIRDVVRVTNRVDLRAHELITFVTYGLTSRIDVSIAIPIVNLRMAVSSNATIVDVSATGYHSFDIRSGCGDLNTPCRNQQFFSSRNASGIADMTLRVKGTAWKGEHAALALGADIRFPTGDSLNYLGAGAAGVKPFVVWSRSARISPHALVGYEVNGSSVIAGDLTTGSKDRLPGQLSYAAGADIRISKRVTAAGDFVGEQVFEAGRLSRTAIPELGQCTPNPLDSTSPNCPVGPNNVGVPDPSLSQSTGTFNISTASVGAKIRPLSNLLITGNVLIRVNDGGLRSNYIPLAGISYTF